MIMILGPQMADISVDNQRANLNTATCLSTETTPPHHHHRPPTRDAHQTPHWPHPELHYIWVEW